MRTQTTTIEPTPVAAQPEFVDSTGLRALFGISRTHAFELQRAGKIRTVCIRRLGAVKGRRLYDCASVRTFLLKNEDIKPRVSEAIRAGVQQEGQSS